MVNAANDAASESKKSSNHSTPPEDAQDGRSDENPDVSSEPDTPSLSSPALTQNQAAESMGMGGSQLPPYMIPQGLGQNLGHILGIAQHQQQSWAAPVPPPEAAERFEHLCPGAFDRMLTLAEKEQASQSELAHKQADTAALVAKEQIVLAKRAQDFLARDTKRGHWLGAGISAVAMAGSVTAAIFDQIAIGLALISVPVMTVAVALINANKNTKAAKTEAKSSNESSENEHAGPPD